MRVDNDHLSREEGVEVLIALCVKIVQPLVRQMNGITGEQEQFYEVIDYLRLKQEDFRRRDYHGVNWEKCKRLCPLV